MVLNKDPEDKTGLLHAIAVENDFAKEGDEEKKEAKAIVFAGASWLNDHTLKKHSIENKRFSLMSSHSPIVILAYRKKDVSGPVNNEQDGIQHSKEGQGWIFFCSSLFIPLFGFGLFRIQRRKKGGV